MRRSKAVVLRAKGEGGFASYCTRESKIAAEDLKEELCLRIG
jgi:hypothetical protein